MPYKDPKIAKEKAAERYQKNIEARKAKMREDYAKKKDAYISRAKEYKESNAEKVKEYQDLYREENREQLRENKKEFYKENRDRIVRETVERQRNNMEGQRKRQDRYYATDKGKAVKRATRNNRRAREKHARLGDAFLKETLEIYKACAIMRQNGMDVEVDHIVPLMGKDVCGLHVPANLRIISTKDNRRKSNSFSDSDLIM